MTPQDIDLPDGLAIRLAHASDADFIASLYRSTRDDLRLINAEYDFIEALIKQQFQAQCNSYGTTYPNAMHFIIEKLNEAIGRLILDVANNNILIVDIALIPVARGKGFGRAVLLGLQALAASMSACQHRWHFLSTRPTWLLSVFTLASVFSSNRVHRYRNAWLGTPRLPHPACSLNQRSGGAKG